MNEQIILDEQSNLIYPFNPAEKITKLKNAVQPYLVRKLEQVELRTKNGGIKLVERELPINPLQIPNTVNRVLREYEPLEHIDLQNSLTKEFLLNCLNCFAEFVDYVNNVRPYIPSKQQVVAFLQMTEASYNKLLNSRDEKIVTALETWESYIIDLTITSSQTEMVKERSTIIRLKAKGIGHSISETQSEDNKVLNEILDTVEVAKKLEQFKKQLGYKDKKNN
jgi:hypothetical protein